MSLPCPGSSGLREWLAQPSHPTGLLSGGAFQFYAIVLGFGWLVYWLFHALGGLFR